MLNNIILASKSKVRKNILEKNNIFCDVKPSNVDEEIVKQSLLNENASPEIISKNLAELKANKVSSKFQGQIVLGADKAKLKMKNFSEKDLKEYLAKISDSALYAYNVYQIEGEGRKLFSDIIGDEDTIMGLPIKKIKEYLKEIK